MAGTMAHLDSTDVTQVLSVAFTRASLQWRLTDNSDNWSFSSGETLQETVA